MPTNLPPEYFEADRRYREAKSITEKSSALEELIKTIPKHKGTDKLRAEFRKKLSKLKSQTQSKKKISRHESHFHIDREGDVRVIIVGTANVGKSSIVHTLTHAKPEISESPYSTWIPTPGIFEYKGVRIQLIDTPAIDRDYLEPELLDLIKNSDIILLMLDLQAYPIDQFQKTLNILQNNGIFPSLGEQTDINTQILNSKMIIAVNKDDGLKLDEEYLVLKELLEEEGWEIIPVSVLNKRNIELLFNEILKKLNVIRVYSKPPHKDADLSRPFVLIKGSNIEDFAEKVHKDFLNNMKSARIWGSEVFDGQKVGHDYILRDGDIVELHM